MRLNYLIRKILIDVHSDFRPFYLIFYEFLRRKVTAERREITKFI